MLENVEAGGGRTTAGRCAAREHCGTENTKILSNASGSLIHILHLHAKLARHSELVAFLSHVLDVDLQSPPRHQRQHWRSRGQGTRGMYMQVELLHGMEIQLFPFQIRGLFVKLKDLAVRAPHAQVS